MNNKEGPRTFSRRETLILAGFGIAGLSAPLILNKLGVFDDETNNVSFKFPEGDPFEDGKDVTVEGLKNKEYLGKIMMSIKDYPVVRLQSEQSGLDDALEEFRKLKINDMGIGQDGTPGFYLYLGFDKGVSFGDKYKDASSLPVTAFVFPSSVYENPNQMINIFTYSTATPSYHTESDPESGLDILSFRFRHNLEEHSNKEIAFLFNKGLTSVFEKPTFLPVKIQIPDLTFNPKRAHARFNLELKA